MSYILHSSKDFLPPQEGLSVQDIYLGKFNHPTKLPENPSIPCLIDDTTERTVYLKDIRMSARSLMKSFRKRWNIGHDDTVAFFSPNHIDYLPCIWATHQLGAIAALLNPTLTEGELEHHLEVATPSLLIANANNLHIAIKVGARYNLEKERIVVLARGNSTQHLTTEDLMEEGSRIDIDTPPPDIKTKIAFLCFSSGTTGLPKAVAITHHNVLSSILQLATYNTPHAGGQKRYRPGEICLGGLPFYHIYGLMFLLHFMLYCQVTVIVTAKFDFVKFLKNIEKFRITHLPIVPPQAILLCKHPASKKADLSSIRTCVLGAAPVSAGIIYQLLERMPNIEIGQGYGMTETTGAVTHWPISQKVGTLGSAGQLVPGTSAKIVKYDRSIAKIGEEGELYVKGLQLCLGYYKNKQATGELFEDGWLKTGDIAKFDENGDLFIIDRVKEFIKVKGFQVAPAELEGHLLSHPLVADAGVVALRDDYAGEVPLAFIVLQHTSLTKKTKDDPLAARAIKDEIYKHVADTKSRYKWLDGGIVFVDALPKSPSGKILRRILREQAAQLHHPATPKL